jgi:hypothetical protein
MKKLLTLTVAVLLGIGTMFANPVDVNTAKSLGQKFVQANFEKTMRAELQLYYTVTSENGEPCVYVFNMGNEGFVLVAASDNVRPILGYSENGPFDASNPYNGAMFMLETYKNSISYAIEENIAATPEIASQWESLRKYGRLSDKRGGTVGPLVQTKWNQNSPYNLYAPPTQGGHQGAGGRCYAGCVATAMSQVMKYWDHPIQGEGSHGYNCVGYGPTYYQYGYQYANFGETTYQWDLMPKTLSNATQEQIEAVATLMYHCGVSVDMTFDWDGSGTYSDLVPGAMLSYFDYDYCVKKNRNSYTLTNWVNMLKAEFDLGRPVYYSGQSSEGGHAFVADGYNEDDFISFNFGWSGSDDDWYAVDAIDYSSSAAAIFNYVPTYVYQNTVQAPTAVNVTKTSDTAQEATITWTNPTKTVTNQNLTTIDEMVVTRNGVVIYTVENATPGASMSFVDSDVPCYSTFQYKVFAVKNGVNGVAGTASESFGPTCNWTIIATATAMSGWSDGKVIAYDGANREIVSFTMTNNSPVSANLALPLGCVKFGWKNGTADVTLSFKLKNSTGDVVYEYPQGSSANIPTGYFFETNNGCGNAAPTEAPSNIYANTDGDNIVLTWTGVSSKDGYGYNIYRDGALFALAHDTEFVDVAPAIGGHCYQVCYLGYGGESEYSNEACGNAGEGCDSGKDLYYEIQSNFKPIIKWTAPEDVTGLTGYYVYRRTDDTDYELIKLVGANKTEYKEAKPLVDDTWYSYRVVAYYQEIECYSAPFKSIYGNEYFVRMHYSTDGVDENMTQSVSIYPNPTKDMLTVKADNLSSVEIYNSIGQMVYSKTADANETVINTSDFEAGIYMVRINANGSEVTKKISVIK